MRALLADTLGYEITHSLITHHGRYRSEALQALIYDITTAHAGHGRK